MRAETEIEALQKLQHTKFVPRIFYSYSSDDNFILIMERGQMTLGEFLYDFSFNAPVYRELALQLKNVIKKIHYYGIYHRDIRADNIMINIGPDGKSLRLFLIDFGYAEFRYDEYVDVNNIEGYIDEDMGFYKIFIKYALGFIDTDEPSVHINTILEYGKEKHK